MSILIKYFWALQNFKVAEYNFKMVPGFDTLKIIPAP
jgi:hypothetical protein